MDGKLPATPSPLNRKAHRCTAMAVPRERDDAQRGQGYRGGALCQGAQDGGREALGEVRSKEGGPAYGRIVKGRHIMKSQQSDLVGMFLVLDSPDHEHYRTGYIAAAVSGYLLQFEKVESAAAEGALHARGAEPDL